MPTEPARAESLRVQPDVLSRRKLLRRNCAGLYNCLAIATIVAALTLEVVAQEKNAAPGTLSPQDIQTLSELAPAFVQLFEQLKHNVQLPPERSQSRLLPLLPPSTIFYAGFANYGEASHQALATFRQEREKDPKLREWWERLQKSGEASQLEEYLDKYYLLSQYLGDEVALSGSAENDGKDASVLLVAEVKKPGLKEVIQQMVRDLAGKTPADVRIFDPPELAHAKDSGPDKKLSILVRPDYLVASLDVPSLRRFNEQLDAHREEFASSPFGQRIAQEYEGGAAATAALDVQQLLALIPVQSEQNRKIFERTGFHDSKYLVWRHTGAAGQPQSLTELSFTGPRHGVASWLIAPGPLTSLEFLSPNATVALGIRLKNFAEIYDDILSIAAISNPNADAAIKQSEQGLRLSLRDDFFGQLAGEIAFELDAGTASNREWRAVLKVNDSHRLQATLDKLLSLQRVGMQQSEEEGVIYYTVQIPSQKAFEFSYAYVDGYMVIASSLAVVKDALRMHHAGDSLAKSQKLLDQLPAAPLSEVSALFYEDPVAMAAFQLQQASPQMAGALAQVSVEKSPVVMCAYGEESALRSASKNGGVDAGAFLVGAAIAIPNLIRARNAANEASAVAMIRTVNTAQISYSMTYPERGYARDLASLGPGPKGANVGSPAFVGMVDASVTNANCTSGVWCTKSGYQFTVKTLCPAQKCQEYVVVATPVDASTGTRNLCSTADMVVRASPGPPLKSPVSASECKTWNRLH